MSLLFSIVLRFPSAIDGSTPVVGYDHEPQLLEFPHELMRVLTAQSVELHIQILLPQQGCRLAGLYQSQATWGPTISGHPLLVEILLQDPDAKWKLALSLRAGEKRTGQG